MDIDDSEYALEEGVYDYGISEFSAYSRVRMMNDALNNIGSVESAHEAGTLDDTNYVHALAINVASYIDQLNRLPEEFWKMTTEKERQSAANLVNYRNNLVHGYCRAPQDAELLHITAVKRIPAMHRTVERFNKKYKLNENRKAYPTTNPERIKPDSKNWHGPVPFKGLISYNRRSIKTLWKRRR